MSERVNKASDLQIPATIEYTRYRDNRGDLVKRVTVVERRGRNLLTDDGDWLWWPTINHYNDVVVINEVDATTNEGVRE